MLKRKLLSYDFGGNRSRMSNVECSSKYRLNTSKSETIKLILKMVLEPAAQPTLTKHFSRRRKIIQQAKEYLVSDRAGE